MGVDIRKLPVRLGVFGAEPWSDAMRHDLEVRLGLVAVDLYGLSEIIGPGVAIECGAVRNGSLRMSTPMPSATSAMLSA
jgi:phenylacetate-CoA ligase